MKRRFLLSTACMLGMVTLIAAIMLHTLGTASGAHAASPPGHRAGQGIPQHWLVPAGQQHSFKANITNNLIYHQGAVMTGTMNVYLIFWEPPRTSVSKTYNSLISSYYQDVGASGLYHNNKQYSDGKNHPVTSTLAATWLDNTKADAYPPGSTLSDGDIQNEVARALTANGWSIGPSNLFVVYTSRGEQICTSFGCSNQAFCGYHNYSVGNTIYAVLPYPNSICTAGVPQSPNHNLAADTAISVSSHEQMEAATDPFLHSWYDNSGQEIGDKCNFNFGSLTLDNGQANVQWNGHYYIVQQEWSNKQSGCVLTGP